MRAGDADKGGDNVSNKRPKRRTRSLARAYEVKAEISNATLAKAKSALTLQIYRKQLKARASCRSDAGPCSGPARGDNRPSAFTGADSRR